MNEHIRNDSGEYWTSMNGDGQHVWEFDSRWHSSDAVMNKDGDVIDFSRLLKRMGADYRGRGKKMSQKLVDMGEKIFPIQTYNDFTAVEGDYGAPAIGLDWFKEVIDPTRSFRYDRLRFQDGDYRTHVTQSNEIGHYLRGRGFKIFKGRSEDQFATYIHFASGGITRAFNDILDVVINQHVKLSPIRNSLGIYQRGAILVPVPTYGLFYYQIVRAVQGQGISVLPVRRTENGAVDMASLKGRIEKCHDNNMRILSYYDCNPNNPTGYVRGRAETEEIAEIMMNETLDQIGRDLSYNHAHQNDLFETYQAARYLGSDGMNSFAKASYLGEVRHLISAVDKPTAGVMLIDDMAYEDLQYDPSSKPYSFGQVSPEVAAFTAVLKGISKIGLPGARIGMVIAHNEITGPLHDRQFEHEFAPSSLGVDLLSARFGAATHKAKFKNHYALLRNEHLYKLGVMEALFHGIDNTSHLDAHEKKQLISDYAAHAQLTPQDALTRLKRGVPNLPLVDEAPEGGFFHRIDGQALYGRMIATTEDNSPYPDYEPIVTSDALYSTFRSFGIHVVPARWQGCPSRDMTVRITMSLPDQDLFRLYDNMRSMHDYFWNNDREVQMDLFRRNRFTPG